MSLIILLKLPKILARISAPAVVNNHPKKLILPYGARTAGSTKIPAPIIPPIKYLALIGIGGKMEKEFQRSEK